MTTTGVRVIASVIRRNRRITELATLTFVYLLAYYLHITGASNSVNSIRKRLKFKLKWQWQGNNFGNRQLLQPAVHIINDLINVCLILSVSLQDTSKPTPFVHFVFVYYFVCRGVFLSVSCGSVRFGCTYSNYILSSSNQRDEGRVKRPRHGSVCVGHDCGGVPGAVDRQSARE